MDSITHIVLGAVVGEALAGRELGKRAMFYGALASSFPDVDVVASLFTTPAQNLLIHRGLTHSFLFATVAAVVLAWGFHQWYRSPLMSWRAWFIFFSVEILLHLVIDACNAYGIGWFEPFSHQRVAFNILFVADPLFTVWPLVAFIALWILRSPDKRRVYWTRVGIMGCLLYLVLALAFKQVVDRQVNEVMMERRIAVKDYITTPTVLNSLLWYVVIRTEEGVYTGYRSVFDGNREMQLTYFADNKWMLNRFEGSELVSRLVFFSQGYYVVTRNEEHLYFHDLRFGQSMGWQNAQAPFVFSFDMTAGEENLLALQRGRFAGWDWRAVKTLWQRMWGHEVTSQK